MDDMFMRGSSGGAVGRAAACLGAVGDDGADGAGLAVEGSVQEPLVEGLHRHAFEDCQVLQNRVGKLIVRVSTCVRLLARAQTHKRIRAGL